MSCLIGYRNSVRIWLMKEFQKELRRDPMQRSADTSSSSQEPPMEPRAYLKPGPGKHRVLMNFPKDPNCEICLKTKITRASCRRRANAVMPRAENFDDLIAAYHKVLSEECESRNNHRYAVVVQDLATQWIQSYPSKSKSSQETQKNLMKFLERRVESGKEALWSRTLKNWSRWTHLNSTPEGPMQRKC